MYAINVYTSVKLCFISMFYCRRQWLMTEGSPQSKIDKCSFSNDRTLKSTQFVTFKIDH